MTESHEDRPRRRSLRIEELIEPDRLVQIFEKDAKTQGVAYRLMDVEGNWIGAPAGAGGFCQIMQSTQKGKEFCLQCNHKHLKNAAESQAPIMHSCQAGVVDSIAAIRVGGEVIGYVHGMQALLEPPSQDQIERVSDLAIKLDMVDKKDAMTAALTQTPIKSKAEVDEATEGLTNLVAELTNLSWYARQVSVFDETNKRIAGFSSKDDIRDALLDGVEALLGEVNICIFVMGEDQCLHLFGARRESRDLQSLAVRVGEGYIGWVAENRKFLLVGDIDEFEKVELLRRDKGSNRALKSVLTVPILSIDGRVVGVLQVAALVVDAFDESDAQSLKVLASIAGMALERYRLESDVKAIKVESRKLPPLELDTILKNYLQTGLRILNFSSAEVGLLTEDGSSLEIRTAVGPLEQHLPLKVDAKLGVSGRVIRQGKTESIKDLTQDADHVEIQKIFGGTPYGSFLGSIGSTVKTPLRIGDKVVGILCIHWVEPNAVPSTAVSVIEVLAEGIEGIIETIRTKRGSSWEEMILDLMGRNIVSGVDIASARQELFQGLADEAMRITPSVSSNVRLYEAKDLTLRFAAVAGEGWTDEIRKRVFTIEEKSAAAYVARTSAPFVINNTTREEQYKELFSNVRSHVSVPIFFRKALAGVLSVDADHENAFSTVDSSNLELLAAQCSMMLEHFALIEERWLYELEIFLSGTSEIGELLEGAKEPIQKLFGVKGWSLFLKYPATDELRLAVTTGINDRRADVMPTYAIGEGITGWIAKNKRTLRLRDTADKEELARVSGDIEWVHKWNESLDYSELEGHYRFLGTPLSVRDEFIGVLRLSIKEDKAYFSYHDELLIEKLAARLALSIQNLWLTEERNRRVKQLEDFTSLGDKLAENLNLKKVAQLILHEGLRIVGCEAGHIRIFDKKMSKLKLVHATGLFKERIAEFRGMGEGISGRVASDREPLRVPDVREHQRYARVLEEVFEQPQDEFVEWVRAVSCFPLVVQNELVGTLNMYWSETKNFDQGELSRLTSDLAYRSAIALKAALMFEEIENELKRKIDALLRVIGMELAQTLDVDTLLNHLLGSALQESDFSSGLVRMLDEQRNKWVLRAAKDDSPDPLTAKLAPELDVKDDILKQAAIAHSATLIADTRSHKGFLNFIADYPGTDHAEFHRSVGSAVVVPIRLKDRCIGLLILNSRARYAFPDSTIKYLELLAGQAAIAIHNAQLYAASERSRQLAQPLAIMGSMMGSFLHETRTPLQRLTGSLNVAEHRNFDKSRLQDFLKKMRKQVETVASVLNDVALFARTDPKALRESVELNSVIEKAVRDKQYSFGRRINCVQNLVRPGAVTRGNRAQLERVFKLVIGNAVDAMPNGGALLIQTSESSDSDRVAVRFKDSGSGMDELTKTRCLEPYFTTKQANGGTGLGLAVVSLIVSHHSGDIKIDSEPGQGTTVTLTFPKGRE